jgi:hypothetical protein
MPDSAGKSLKKPHMGAGSGQFHVAQTLPTDFGKGNLHTALVTDHPPVLHAFVFSTKAFPIRDRTEDTSTEKPISLWLEGAVIDRLRLGDFAAGPGANLLRRSQTNPDRLKVLQELSFVKITKESQAIHLLSFTLSPPLHH